MAITQTVPSKFYGSIIKFPLWVDAVVLNAADAESYTVPAGASFCLITTSAPIYACISGTAVVPTTEISDGTASFLVSAGTQVSLDSGETLSMIRASAQAIVTIGVYKFA